jgi:hypothetical protein
VPKPGKNRVKIQAEIIPLKPDPDNAGGGKVNRIIPASLVSSLTKNS